MNMVSKNWVKVGVLSDIPKRGARCVIAGETRIAIFRTEDDSVYAMEDKCPHMNGPLSQGIVHDGCVTCPLHNWVISLATGEAQGADEGTTRTFGIKLEADDILLEI